jgi:hypothetical protein
MSGMNLRQLNELLMAHADVELEGLAVEFLHAFRPDEPLEEQGLKTWMADKRPRYPRDVLSAAQEAIRNGWVADAPDGLRLTEEGKEKKRAADKASLQDSALSRR